MLISLLARALTVLAVVASMLAGNPAAAQAEEVGPALPTRILLYGDSQTMGSSGDWTWRYRLWQDLQLSGTAFDFVGPRNDVMSYSTFTPGSQGYRNAQFDRDHSSMGGMRFLQSYVEVSALTSWYRPDVVVGLIGGNDLLRRTATPWQLAEKWRTQIAAARSVSPDTDFVLVQQPVTWLSGVPEYNARLVALAAALDTPRSRVVATGLASFYPYTDTYDLVHPSAMGERRIARQVAAALASIKVGTGPHPGVADTSSSLTAMSWTPWTPTATVEVSAGELRVGWAAVDHASAQDVHVVDVTAGTSRVTRVKGTTWSTPVAAGHEYQVRLSPVKGYLRLGTTSAVQSVIAPH